ncbi:uncharacterized protein LOC132055913 [Lycium ferocissimum]|uniref:uncharacterized protein LOC132055913 n=1 Tax=Lycium ferocissimum TaxID=112874 RepID=UPI002816717B|nr:uncharacterized protein LOC132055913 [Lycium ferocissimum]
MKGYFSDFRRENQQLINKLNGVPTTTTIASLLDDPFLGQYEPVTYLVEADLFCFMDTCLHYVCKYGFKPRDWSNAINNNCCSTGSKGTCQKDIIKHLKFRIPRLQKLHC